MNSDMSRSAPFFLFGAARSLCAGIWRSFSGMVPETGRVSGSVARRDGGELEIEDGASGVVSSTGIESPSGTTALTGQDSSLIPSPSTQSSVSNTLFSSLSTSPGTTPDPTSPSSSWIYPTPSSSIENPTVVTIPSTPLSTTNIIPTSTWSSIKPEISSTASSPPVWSQTTTSYASESDTADPELASLPIRILGVLPSMAQSASMTDSQTLGATSATAEPRTTTYTHSGTVITSTFMTVPTHGDSPATGPSFTITPSTNSSAHSPNHLAAILSSVIGFTVILIVCSLFLLFRKRKRDSQKRMMIEKRPPEVDPEPTKGIPLHSEPEPLPNPPAPFQNGSSSWLERASVASSAFTPWLRRSQLDLDVESDGDRSSRLVRSSGGARSPDPFTDRTASYYRDSHQFLSEVNFADLSGWTTATLESIIVTRSPDGPLQIVSHVGNGSSKSAVGLVAGSSGQAPLVDKVPPTPSDYDQTALRASQASSG